MNEERRANEHAPSPPETRRLAILSKTGGRCAYCGAELTLASMTADHVMPKARGGGNGLANLLPACHECNRDKGQQTLEQWRRRIGRAKLRMPSFTNEQRRWLAAHGYAFPNEAKEHLFWFEQRQAIEEPQGTRRNVSDG